MVGLFFEKNICFKKIILLKTDLNNDKFSLNQREKLHIYSSIYNTLVMCVEFEIGSELFIIQ